MLLVYAGRNLTASAICWRSLVMVDFRISIARGWSHCVIQCWAESGCTHNGHFDMRAWRAGSSIALVWLRPCQCLSKSSRLHSDRLVELVVNCQSVLARGILSVCQRGGSLAFCLNRSLVCKYVMSLLWCTESMRERDVYCPPILPKYQKLGGDIVKV